MAVFVHPAAPLVGQERLTKYYFPLIVGNPLETAVAISKLIYGGVLERLPDLPNLLRARGRCVPVHARTASTTAGRSARRARSRSRQRPREYARLLYFDSLTHSPSNLRFLVAEFGAERVVMGSDYPFDMGSPDPVAAIGEAGLDPARAGPRRGETAAAFLGL